MRLSESDRWTILNALSCYQRELVVAKAWAAEELPNLADEFGRTERACKRLIKQVQEADTIEFS